MSKVKQVDSNRNNLEDIIQKKLGENGVLNKANYINRLEDKQDNNNFLKHRKYDVANKST